MSVSFLDELDEYDAELELEIKREYRSVQHLFHYFVCAGEHSYLTNKVDVSPELDDIGGVVVTMEDAWVWDPDRGNRLLTGAEVHTRGEYTIEKLVNQEIDVSEITED